VIRSLSCIQLINSLLGHTPNTAFLDGQIKVDDTGYIITQGHSTATSIDGVFAAGDVQDKIYRYNPIDSFSCY